MRDLRPKTPSESRTEMADLILPAQANNLGTIFGGEVMSYADRIAAIAATRHSRSAVVTASFDSLDFLAPIKVGHTILLRAILTWAGRTSMEVQVTIESEDLISGVRKVTGISYLTFVAVDSEGKPIEVPVLLPETEEEKFQFERAQERRLLRKKRRDIMDA